ncbi:hypothetical protein E2C01_027940 [Portunus trituberculatus]|uniref:Peptidase A2 domain-containing protein n=1 Tax=Portunus trituberculatus TaxID=210409 RepID=A0A5B7EMP8_PORTR|nr:hypothetical protein [Portunus trituberculatus]
MRGTADGQPYKLVVDTGAERMFVCSELVSACHLPEASQQLCGGTGHCTSLQNPLSVQISVGSREMMLSVFVAALEDPCLLSLDYLMQVGTCADQGRKRMRVGGEELPLLPGDGPAENRREGMYLVVACQVGSHRQRLAKCLGRQTLSALQLIVF